VININFIFQSEGDSVAVSQYRFSRVIPTRSISISPEKSYVNEDCNENDEMGGQRH